MAAAVLLLIVGILMSIHPSVLNMNNSFLAYLQVAATVLITLEQNVRLMTLFLKNYSDLAGSGYDRIYNSFRARVSDLYLFAGLSVLKRYALLSDNNP